MILSNMRETAEQHVLSGNDRHSDDPGEKGKRSPPEQDCTDIFCTQEGSARKRIRVSHKLD